MPVTFSGGGASSFDGWTNLTTAMTNLAGYPGFPGTEIWPRPIRSQSPGSGDASLIRLGGAIDGGPFPAEESLYFGSYQQNTNALGGTLAVNETTPVAGLKTIVLQIQIGEAVGYDFVSPSGLPVLKINNTTNRISSTYHRHLLSRYSNGTFFSPVTETNEPVYLNTWAFQWNVTNTVTSFQIEFSAVTHAQIYALQLDQSSVSQNYQVLKDPAPSVPSGPPSLQLLARGNPVFTNASTIITNTFRSQTNLALDLEYSPGLNPASWTRVTNIATGSGDFSVAFTNAGDWRTSWNQRMYFRARHSP